MYIAYGAKVNMYDASTEGIGERMINGHYHNY